MRVANARFQSAQIIALLLVVRCASMNARTSFDVTKSTDLGGLLVSSAVTVVATGYIRSEIWGEPVASLTYDLSAPVSVQVACYGTTSGEWTTQRGRYQLRVTLDPDARIRKRILNEIYRYWRAQTPEYLASYQYLPADKSVLEKNGRYVLYIKPGHEREGATYMFYANSRLFELQLKAVDGGGWGPLSSLIAEHLAFRQGGELFEHIYFEPKYPPAKLVAEIEAGALR